MDPLVGSLTWQGIAFLFLIAVVAGTIDTLAGGGGLLTIPALMMCGVPPLWALGTNKFQGSVGTATASWIMFRKGRVRWHQVRGLMLGSLVGAVIGTLLVQQIHTQWLSWIVPVVLCVIVTYFLFAPRPVENRPLKENSTWIYRRFAVPLIGAYDGFFGPATGSFFALAGVSLLGQSMVDATARAKVLNCASNVASLVIYLISGHILWLAAGVMLLGQMIGACLGSRILFRINPNYLRWLVVVMSASMLVRYFIVS
ncbi:TSUP family transporter [Celerinatantimonas sp. YJH-8]|uniref:TSUP family transporter n=1 Tax=Celerinatantimonas sp. YJH-8 TaxID=3228714 RepID=UPI0038C61CD1